MQGVILAEFAKVAKPRDFCLAHLLTNRYARSKSVSLKMSWTRDFGCVIGLANIGGLCKNYGNVGWSKVGELSAT